MISPGPRRAALVVGAALGLVYLATLAPGVTLWDAGEFAAAVDSLGIPHPPGTPLFVLVARAWRLLMPFAPTVLATNLLAAVATAAAAAIAGAMVARWTTDDASGIAAGLAFGGVSTVWLNATETEVYAASLLLSLCMLWAGNAARDRARRGRLGRHDLLLCYLVSLSPPLHLSALVAAPGAIALATLDDAASADWSRAAALAAVAAVTAGLGTASLPLLALGVGVLAVRIALARERRRQAFAESLAALALVTVATSVFLYLRLRAPLDPAINQGNPDTIAAVIDVVGRRQYDVPGLWPRRAPLWLQIGNLFQYTDWQFALGLDRSVGASWWRTPFTPLFLGLAVVGSRAHRRRDRRTWAALAVLVGSATLGVVLYLNLRAGPSFGYGVLPAGAEREARERDYFFALGFAAVGMWIGQGAVAAVRMVLARWKRSRAGLAGVVLASLPLALNWHAVNRRREPAASLPNAFARATLSAVPPRGVLFVAGDNDTYPLWYVRVAERVRSDVTIVTVPLLGASWYRAELARRDALYDVADTSGWRGTRGEMAAVAARAARIGRPVAAAVALSRGDREALGGGWSFRGLIFARTETGHPADPVVDAGAVDSTAALVSRLFPGPIVMDRLDDQAARYLASLLTCPRLAQESGAVGGRDSTGLLASRCNFR